MPETDSFLPEGFSSKGLTIIDKNGGIVDLPPNTQWNDLVIVKKDEGANHSLPNGLIDNAFTLVDKMGEQYLILNGVEMGLASAVEETNDLVNPPLKENETNATNLAGRLLKDVAEYIDGDFELADINTVLMEEVEKDKFRKGVKHGDVSLKEYNFDGNNVYATGDAGVEIDGFLFFPEEVKGEESYAHREYTRTKIMSGGEFVTRGQYVPKEFSFSTTLDIDPNQPYMYDKLFQIMENKACEVVSPYMGDIFKAEVQIDKTHPNASPGSLKLEIKVKEIVDPKTTLVGDTPIKYPSTNQVEDISVKTIDKHEPQENNNDPTDRIIADASVYYPDTGQLVTPDTNPLSSKNWNEFVNQQNQNNG